jgi:lysozyme
METYKIKQGDTLSKIAKIYGVSVAELTSNNSIQDPNLIQIGQSIKIPQNKTLASSVINSNMSPAISPVISNNEVNLGNLPETPITPSKEQVTVLSYKDNPDGTTTNFLSDGSTSTVTYTKNPDKTITPTEVTPTTTTDPNKTKTLLDESSQLQTEISTLEESIANKSNARDSAYQDAGVFDDIKKLNELKDTLKVKLEERQKIRGLGATATEFSQATTPELEKNYLASAALANVINVNIAAIDQKINDKYESDTFLIKQKDTRLNNIVKTYGDIITGDQSAKLEAAKQVNAIELENLRAKNDMIKSASEAAIKAGANPADVLNAVNSGDTSKLYSMSGNTKVDPAQQIGTVNLIQSMLDNAKGLSSSVGPTLFGKAIIPGANAEKFRTDAMNVASQSTLEYFTKLKANGATFGAMTDSEWNIVTQASPAASLGINKDTGKSNLGEAEFIKRAQAYQNAARKAVTASAMTTLGYNAKILKDLDANAIKSYYDKYVVNVAPTTTDYTKQDTGAESKDISFIQKEEGFSPTAYKDQAGVWTIGYGTTKINGVPVKPTDTITQENAKALALEQAVNEYSTFADKLGETPLTPNQFTALNSFEYNLGPGVWNQPTGKQILASIQKGDLKTAQSLMQKFINVKNPQTGILEPNPTLITRRQREGELLLS